jgi:UDP-3-O-[3-hydroxymyristoyl] glucosamine N-acyltransferase
VREVVLYAIGSPIVADFEESLSRAGVSIAAAVRNFAGESYLLDARPLVDLEDLADEFADVPFLVPLFTPGNRYWAVQQAQRRGFRQAYSLVDPSVAVPRSFRAQPGLFINSGCSIGAACQLDEFVFVNRGVSLGHHARLGRFTSIGPGAVIGSFAQIDPGALVGAGAVLLPKIHVGPDSVVGAGSVVTRDVPPNCQVVGNPARIVKRDLTGYGDVRVA